MAPGPALHRGPGSFAEERYNGLDAFLFTDASGATKAVRWSLLPQAAVQDVAPDELAKLGANFLQPELQKRIAGGPIAWKMTLTTGAPGEPDRRSHQGRGLTDGQPSMPAR